MRLLRVLGFVVVLARRSRDVFLAIIATKHRADVRNGFRRHVDAVGTHIRNQAGRFAVDLHAFVEPLGETHGDCRSKAELSARLLLHGRGGEGRRRIAPCGLCLDRRHLEGGVLEVSGERFGFGAGADVETLDLLSVRADQARFEHFVARRRKLGEDRPILFRDEFLDFEFAIANKPKRDRLHASGRARTRQLPPQHRREGEADEIVERAAREVGINQCGVDDRADASSHRSPPAW